MAGIKNNLEKIKEKIKIHAGRAGRNPEDIEIVAVTKGVAIEAIKEALGSGINKIGENRVQEAKIKREKIKESVEWQLVGHLQTNKARAALEIFNLIHSVDSLKLAEVLDKQAASQNKTAEVLIQLNISKDKTKFGLDEIVFFDFTKKAAELKNLAVKGLMTITPYSNNPEDSRPYFQKLQQIFNQVKELNLPNVEMKWLSMGMSADFEVAVEEGANLLRIGRAIFLN